MSNRVLSIIITAKNMVGQVTEAAAGQLRSFADKVKGMFSGLGGIAAIGGIVAAFKSLLNAASEIHDRADMTGFSTRNIQALSLLADRGGVNVNMLVGHLTRLRDIQEGIGRDTAMQEVFQRLGIAVEEVAQANPEELIALIGKRLRETGDAGAVFDIFGTRAAALIPILSQVADGVGEVADELDKDLISDDNLKKLRDADDTLKEFGNSLKVVGSAVVGGISSGIEWLSRKTIDAWGEGGPDAARLGYSNEDEQIAKGRAAKAARLGIPEIRVERLQAEKEEAQRKEAESKKLLEKEAAEKAKMDRILAPYRAAVAEAEAKVKTEAAERAAKIEKDAAEEAARVRVKAAETAVRVSTKALEDQKNMAETMQGAASERYATAKAESEQAWAEWMNPDLAKQRIAGEKGTKAAESDYEKTLRQAEIHKSMRLTLTDREQSALRLAGARQAEAQAAADIGLIRAHITKIDKNIEKIAE